MRCCCSRSRATPSPRGRGSRRRPRRSGTGRVWTPASPRSGSRRCRCRSRAAARGRSHGAPGARASAWSAKRDTDRRGRRYRSANLNGWAQRARAEAALGTVQAKRSVAWMGPMLGATGGPCWACLEHHLRANRPARPTWSDGAPRPVHAPSRGATGQRGGGRQLRRARVGALGRGGQRHSLDHHLSTLNLPRSPPWSTGWCGGRSARRAATADDQGARLRPRAPRASAQAVHRRRRPPLRAPRRDAGAAPSPGEPRHRGRASVGPLAGRDHPLRPVYPPRTACAPSTGHRRSTRSIGPAWARGEAPRRRGPAP